MIPKAPASSPIAPDWLSPQPLESASALPADCYIDPAVQAWDAAEVLGRGWQLAAHLGQLRQAGDHVLVQIGTLPLVLVRDEGGALRALHNVCRHRAGPLVLGSGSGLRSLSCQYHGWTYRLDGVLRGAPDMPSLSASDASRICLPQARLACWQGLVFVNLDPTGVPFEALVDGIDARVQGRSLDTYRFARRVVYDVDCDWKLYVENFLEGYHVPKVHPGLNALLDYRSYTTTCERWHSLQFSPLESAPDLYGQGEALYYFLYPNTMLNLLPGRMQTNRVVPAGAGRCQVIFDYFYAPGEYDEARIARDIAFSDAVQAEDGGICKAVQHGMASGSYRPGRLNPLREQGVHHFHERLREAYRSAFHRMVPRCSD